MGGKSRGQVRAGVELSINKLVANSECVDWEESSCRGDGCIVQISNSVDRPASFSSISTLHKTCYLIHCDICFSFVACEPSQVVPFLSLVCIVMGFLDVVKSLLTLLINPRLTHSNLSDKFKKSQCTILVHG
jgi:hypothetical protein